eukprot:CFRG4741T1
MKRAVSFPGGELQAGKDDPDISGSFGSKESSTPALSHAQDALYDDYFAGLDALDEAAASPIKPSSPPTTNHEALLLQQHQSRKNVNTSVSNDTFLDTNHNPPQGPTSRGDRFSRHSWSYDSFTYEPVTHEEQRQQRTRSIGRSIHMTFARSPLIGDFEDDDDFSFVDIDVNGNDSKSISDSGVGISEVLGKRGSFISGLRDGDVLLDGKDSIASDIASLSSDKEGGSVGKLSVKPSGRPSFVDVKSAEVVDYQIQDGDRPYALFRLNVQIGNRHWTVHRRFNDFKNVHGLLGHTHTSEEMASLVLPPQRIFKRKKFDPAYLYERCEQLDDYIHMLLSLPALANDPIVLDFLSHNWRQPKRPKKPRINAPGLQDGKVGEKGSIDLTKRSGTVPAITPGMSPREIKRIVARQNRTQLGRGRMDKRKSGMTAVGVGRDGGKGGDGGKGDGMNLAVFTQRSQLQTQGTDGARGYSRGRLGKKKGGLIAVKKRNLPNVVNNTSPASVIECSPRGLSIKKQLALEFKSAMMQKGTPVIRRVGLDRQTRHEYTDGDAIGATSFGDKLDVLASSDKVENWEGAVEVDVDPIVGSENIHVDDTDAHSALPSTMAQAQSDSDKRLTSTTEVTVTQYGHPSIARAHTLQEIRAHGHLQPQLSQPSLHSKRNTQVYEMKESGDGDDGDDNDFTAEMDLNFPTRKLVSRQRSLTARRTTPNMLAVNEKQKRHTKGTGVTAAKPPFTSRLSQWIFNAFNISEDAEENEPSINDDQGVGVAGPKDVADSERTHQQLLKQNLLHQQEKARQQQQQRRDKRKILQALYVPSSATQLEDCSRKRSEGGSVISSGYSIEANSSNSNGRNSPVGQNLPNNNREAVPVIGEGMDVREGESESSEEHVSTGVVDEVEDSSVVESMDVIDSVVADVREDTGVVEYVGLGEDINVINVPGVVDNKVDSVNINEGAGVNGRERSESAFSIDDAMSIAIVRKPTAGVDADGTEDTAHTEMASRTASMPLPKASMLSNPITLITSRVDSNNLPSQPNNEHHTMIAQQQHLLKHYSRIRFNRLPSLPRLSPKTYKNNAIGNASCDNLDSDANNVAEPFEDTLEGSERVYNDHGDHNISVDLIEKPREMYDSDENRKNNEEIMLFEAFLSQAQQTATRMDIFE